MEIFQFAFMQRALLVAVFMGILCPCIGIFLVLRRYSMIGDTLSHASLAGVTIGLLTDKSPILGAFIFTSLCGGLIEFLRGAFKKHTELILNIVLALSVGIAISIISSGKLNTSADAFMFGSMLTVTTKDVWMIVALGCLAVLVLLKLYHQMLYIAYDEETAQIIGVKVKCINYIFFVLVAAAISVSIRMVGVLVLSSMISLPVATALQLEKGFLKTLLFSIGFSLVDVVGGLVLSYYLNVAPGGFIAITCVITLLLVMLGRRILLYCRMCVENKKRGGMPT